MVAVNCAQFAIAKVAAAAAVLLQVQDQQTESMCKEAL